MQADDGKTIKAVPRYQQYRAVSKAVDRIQTGKTKQQDGTEDRRGGVIWHTQGSGKSLSMTFLVRKMRTVPGLRRTKIVIVTDRSQLQHQLSKTLELSGEKVDTARKMIQARRLLSQHGPGIVCVMIQKQQDDAEIVENLKDADIIEGKAAPRFPLLNADESIVLLVDEAHRSHASKLHENLMEALPNCARVGFTGTPIACFRWATDGAPAPPTASSTPTGPPCSFRPSSSTTSSFTSWPTSVILTMAWTSGAPSSARCPTSPPAAPASA